MQSNKSFHFFAGFLLTFLVAFTVQSQTFPDFTGLIEEKSPAVIKITAKTKGNKNSQPQIEIPENMPEMFKHFFDPRRMPERESQASGSGFLISSDGYILTNNHVVEGATDVVVRLIDRREYDAKVIGTDPQSDLALLKIEEKGLPFLTLADSDKSRVGEWVLAIGAPFGLDYSVTAGIISAIGRSIPGGGRQNQNYVPFIQTDVAINPGNSGGPLFNLDGNVIGINSQIYTRSGGSIGLSFAIPSNIAMDVVEQLKSNGKVLRGWLGVVIQDVDKDLALSFGLKKPQGALIAQMEPNGPAEKSGLKVGDIILNFNGSNIETSSDLPHAVGPVRAGTKVPVNIIRKGKNKKINVTVGTRNGEVLASLSTPPDLIEETLLGIVVEELSSEVKKSIGMSGVLIKQVSANTPASEAGLEPGDILVQLGFNEVGSVKDFKKIESNLPNNKPQPIRIIRNGSPLFRSIVIEK